MRLDIHDSSHNRVCCHTGMSYGFFFPFHRHLTYDTEQARFAMSSTSTWANIDGPFSYSDFYWKIVGLFEDEEEAAALIKFYNLYVLKPSTFSH